MKHNRTATLFFCAIASVIVALFITSVTEPYHDNFTDADNSAVKEISSQDFEGNPSIKGIVIHREMEEDLFEEVTLFFEDRDNIKFINQDCYGESPYKVQDMLLSVNDNILDINMPRDDSISDNSTCSEIEIYLPNDVELINLSALSYSRIYINSEDPSANLNIITASGFNMSGQYEKVQIWQVGLSSDYPQIYIDDVIYLSEANIEEISFYGQNVALNINQDVRLQQGTIHSSAEGSVAIFNNEHLNRLSYFPLQEAELEQLKLLNKQTPSNLIEESN